MRTNSPVKGLLKFSLQSSSGNFAIAMLVCLALGVALLVTGNATVYTFFVTVTITFPPMFFMMGSAGGGNSSKWERFRISMPVRRKDVIASNYLGVILTSLVGLPIFLVFSGLSVFLHADLTDLITSTALYEFTRFFCVALFTASIFYPLVNTIGGNKGEGLLMVCMLGGVGFILGVSWIGGRAELSESFVSILTITVSIAIYLISFVATQKIYAKRDF